MGETIPRRSSQDLPHGHHRADLCNRIILDFLTKDPAPTFMPIRRA